MTAFEQYKEAQLIAHQKIDVIKGMLSQHDSKFDGTSWGYVGDLNQINIELEEIINKLNDTAK